MKRLFRGFALGFLFLAPAATSAQDLEAEVAVEEADVNTGAFTLTGGVDYTTHYFFRGYLQEDQDLILQPYVTLAFDLGEADGPLTGYIGMWHSFHGEQTGADDGTFGAWYEADFYAGVDMALGDAFTLGLIYTAYTYPNGAFDTIEELGVRLSYDDADKTGLPFALKPYAGLYFETDDRNGSEDTYLELGIVPTVYTFNEDGDQPIALAVPIAVGTSVEDYYFDDEGDEEFLGYGSIGLAASMPLGSGRYGDWTLNASVTWMQLFAEGLESANNDDDNEIIGKVGVSFTY